MDTVNVVAKMASKLVEYGMSSEEATERARNIVQIAVCDGCLRHSEVSDVIRPSEINTGIADPVDRINAARELVSIWVAETSPSEDECVRTLNEQLGLSSEYTRAWLRGNELTHD